jgi:hypothetical protein
MSIFKNTTSMSGVSGESMWFPQQKGGTSKWWPKYDAKPGMGKADGRMPANPHMGAKMTNKMRHKM